MHLLARPSKSRIRLGAKGRKAARVAAVTVLLGGAGYMGWAAWVQYRRSDREIVERSRASALANLAANRAAEAAAAAEAKLSVAAFRSPVEAANYLHRLIAQGRLRGASDWIGQLPAPLRDSPPIRSCHAELLAASGQWEQLHQALLAGAWGAPDPFALKLAFTAHLAQQTARAGLAADLWKAARQADKQRAQRDGMLPRLGKLWGLP